MKSNIGQDLFSALKKNNTTTIAVIIGCTLITLGALLFAFMVYKENSTHVFAVGKNGDLLPLSKLDEQESNIIQVKANIAYFVDNYYSMNANNMKSKREKVFWLVGSQPTEVIKDRATKGYFDNFLTIAGLQQNAKILEQTLKVTGTNPYNASCVVRIERNNNGAIEYYNNTINLVLEKVHRNYPYNPYGLLITKFSENLERIADPNTDQEKDILKESDNAINQNPKDINESKNSNE